MPQSFYMFFLWFKVYFLIRNNQSCWTTVLLYEIDVRKLALFVCSHLKLKNETETITQGTESCYKSVDWSVGRGKRLLTFWHRKKQQQRRRRRRPSWQQDSFVILKSLDRMELSLTCFNIHEWHGLSSFFFFLSLLRFNGGIKLLYSKWWSLFMESLFNLNEDYIFFFSFAGSS